MAADNKDNKGNPDAVTDVQPMPNAMMFVHSERTFIFVTHPLLIELTKSTDGSIILTHIKDASLYAALMADVDKKIESLLPEARAFVDALSGKTQGES